MIRVGTRASTLARWQTDQVAMALRRRGRDTDVVELSTTGDVMTSVPLAEIGSVAIFTRQLDEALLDRRIDVAVHSLKDLPTRLEPGILLAAIGPREDPTDAFIGKTSSWEDLPANATVATSSVRRKAQLLHVRPDLEVVPIRGNVETRLAKLDRSAEWDGTVLATAGLVRLGLADRITDRLPPGVMLPAPGQGSVAVTIREGDADMLALVAEFEHRPSALCGAAERGLLRSLDGGCQVPVAALAEIMPGGSTMRLVARVLSLDGHSVLEASMDDTVPSPEAADALGIALAQVLIDQGADEVLREARGEAEGPAS